MIVSKGTTRWRCLDNLIFHITLIRKEGCSFSAAVCAFCKLQRNDDKVAETLQLMIDLTKFPECSQSKPLQPLAACALRAHERAKRESKCILYPWK